jgi:hypothetical protein
MKDALINAVIEQIKTDIENGDYTALAEMLGYIPDETLEAFLPEVEMNK